ncbi:glycosyltransferase family 2 protein [Ferrimicrobium acidiphilum]|uniref:SPBc2 prophage-derived glycosyltransferase SunS n=1 Tax=Ferrimicrobium acidiphilum DSM 19497 TaxID=1121877 RepID=A0A0D8FWE2_9ACTN|nr:glycosyltransferase family 2 protein [Ferrimicrobium acidiphilum]KJE77234.1 SPBc2 prophage-derived glycosyltransferase SunS [Ferrimicrobium acidiphilum DSM 19497]
MNLSEELEVIRGLLLESEYDTVRESIIKVLREEPRSAQAWVFVGELSERTGRPYQAWQAYRRAWLLDPQAAWISDVRGRLVDVGLEELEPWFDDLFRVVFPSVAAAMIVKDEVANIARCVGSLMDAVDEIVVVDTGSGDGTVDVVEKLGVRVWRYGWTGSFAEARNFALSKVKSQWVLWVDGDEWLDPEDVDAPRIAAGLFDSVGRPLALRVVQVNDVGGRIEPNNDMSRMHPTGYGIKWAGRIHEQLVLGADTVEAAQGISRVAVNIRLNHVGYHPKVMQDKGKLERNIDLLERSVADDPSDVASWGFLGRELLFSGDIDRSIAALYRAETLAREAKWYGRIAEVRNYLIEALLRQERFEEAQAVANRGVKDNPEYPGLWYSKGRVELMRLIKLLNSAREAFERSQTTAVTYRGIVAFESLIPVWRAKAGIADVTRFSGDLAGAKRLYEELLRIDPNLSQMQAQIDRINQQARVLSAGLVVEDSPVNSIDEAPSGKV